nr:hypothetical protein [Psychrobacter sp. PraFG1]UNK05108.1 hypothetical protein MN210_14020 [Psychrobacter sp. PraFG1]
MALYQVDALPINNAIQPKELEKVAQLRVELYQQQLKRTEFFIPLSLNYVPLIWYKP